MSSSRVRSSFKIYCAAAVTIPALAGLSRATSNTGIWTGANSATDSNWSDAGNWLGSVIPQANGDIATFNTGSGIPTTVNLDQNYSVGTLNFYGTNAGTWNIGSSGGNTLAINGSTPSTATGITINNSSPVISVNLNANLTGNLGGDLVVYAGLSKTTPQVLTLAGNNNFSGGEIDLEQGQLDLANANALNGIKLLYLNENNGSTGNSVLFNASGIVLNCTVQLNRVTGLVLNGGNTLVSGTVVSGTSSGSFATTAAGDVYSGASTTSALILSAINTNTNGWTVGADTRLVTQSNQGFGTNTSAGGISVASGGTLGFQSSAGSPVVYAVNTPVNLNNNGANDGAGAIGGILNYSGINSFNGPISLVTSATKFSGLGANAGTLTLGGVISSTTTTALQKLGPGTVALSGANTYTGGTNISAGTLLAENATALGAGTFTGTNSGVIVGSAARLNFYTGTGGTLNIGTSSTPTTLNLKSGSAIGGELGGLIHAGTATTTGSIAVDVYGSPAIANPSGNYTLVSSTSTSGGLSSATYSVGNVYNDTNFSVSGVSATPGALNVSIATATALTNAYWTGGFTGGPVWALSNGTSSSNWAANPDGSGVSNLVPAATTNVFLSASGAANQSSMTLGVPMSIASLTVSDTNPVTLTDTNTLTISGGIAVNSGAAHTTLGVPVALTGNAPSINVNSSNGLVINGVVSAANLLTVNGSGSTTFNGTVNASGGLTIAGPGNAIFTGAIINNSTGLTSVAGGAMVLNQPSGTVTLLANSSGGGFAGNLVVATPIRVNFDSGSFSGGGQIQVQTSGAALTNSNTAPAVGPGTISNAISLNSTGKSFTKGNVTSSTYAPGSFVTTIGGTTSPNTTAPITFSEVISGNSDLNIANNATNGGGGGPVVLGLAGTPGGSSGYETYTGTTSFNGNGLVTLASSNVFPTSTDVIVGTQSGIGTPTLNLNGFNQTIGSISDGANVTATAHNLTITNNGSSAAVLTFGNSITPFNGSSAIFSDGTSTLGLLKTGTDTITLSGSHNNFSGGVIINQGTLTATGTLALGNGIVTVNPTGTSGTGADAATLNTKGGSVANGTALTVNTNSPTAIGTVNFSTSGPAIGSLSGNGRVVLQSSTGTVLQIGYTNNLSSTFSGLISEAVAGQGSIIKAGNGTLTLSGSSTYTGVTTITGGTLVAGAANALAQGSAFNISAGTLDASAFPETIASLNVGSAGSLNLGYGSILTVTGAASFGGTLNLLGTPGTLPQTLMTYSSETGSFTAASVPAGDRLSYGATSLQLVVAGPSSLIWTNAAGNGTWDTTSPNWNNGTGTVAYSDNSNISTGDIVTFNDNNNGGYNVTIASAVHPTSVIFAASGDYNVSGAAIAGTGSVTLTGSGKVTLSSSNTYTGGTFVNAGSLVLASTNALPNNTSLNIASGAVVSIANHGSSATYVPQASALINNGTLDITNNAMVIHNGSIGTVTAQVQNAFNNGAWNGTNSSSGVITSSTAAMDGTHLTAIGVATGLTTFEGQTVSPSDVLIKYTYYGDANLDGQVNSADYTRIDSAYLNNHNGSNVAVTGWFNGDFNYDGTINGSDYTLIDNAFNTQGVALADSIANPSAVATAQVAGGSSAVPEPSVLGLLGIGAAGLLSRRRKMIV